MATRTISRRSFAAGAIALCGLGLFSNPLAAFAEAEKTTGETRVFTDSLGREVELPVEVTRYVPSGSIAQQVLMTIAPQKMARLSSELTESQKKYFGEKYG